MSEATDVGAVYSRTLQAADRLFECLTDVEAIGGVVKLTEAMSPKSRARLITALDQVRQAIGTATAGKPAAAPKPRPKPRPKPPG